MSSEHNPSKVGLDDWLFSFGDPDRARAELDKLLSSASTPRATDAKEGKQEREKKPTPAKVLTDLALANFDLWHDDTEEAYATNGRETVSVKSKRFKLWLTRRYRAATGGDVPSGEAMTTARTAIEAVAVLDGTRRTAYVRIGNHGGNVYLDLGDGDNTVIEITPQGWGVCEHPPISFRRSPGSLPLPVPERGGSLTSLQELLNLGDPSQFSLLSAWMCGCFSPNGPYPILVSGGQQGSGKSMLMQAVKRLIDPTAAAKRKAPKNTQDLMIAAKNAFLLSYDNLSHLPDWLSDDFCTLATGGGFDTRELYTNDDQVIIDVKRPVAFNSIEDVASRADLLERAVVLSLPTIPKHKRRTEKELWARFDAARPKVLGALLDRVVVGLREHDRVVLADLPRMADFAKFAVACEMGLPQPARLFLRAYAENQSKASEIAMDDSPLAHALSELATRHFREAGEGPPEPWDITATDLLLQLNAARSPDDARDREKSKGWPKSPSALSSKLRRIAPTLRDVCCLDIDTERRESGGNRTRFIRIVSTKVPASGRDDHGPSRPGGVPSSSRDPAHYPADGYEFRRDGGDGGDGVFPTIILGRAKGPALNSPVATNSGTYRVGSPDPKSITARGDTRK